MPCVETESNRALRIEDFKDYRSFLFESFQRRKRDNPRYSYRLLAGKLALDVAHVHRILNGRNHLSSEAAHRMASVLALDEKAARHLIDLVGSTRHRSAAGPGCRSGGSPG
jgi:uncharacterized protein (TIGR02147 family)